MKYEKKIVSFYDNPNFSSVPICFLEIDKQVEKYKLSLSQLKEKDGYFFICKKNRCFVKDLSKQRIFIFYEDFFDENEYLFVIKSKKCSLFGRIGKIENLSQKIKNIDKKYLELLNQKKIGESIDKNKITDWIVSKMFGEDEKMFFNQTKKQLENAFLTQKHCFLLEKTIPESKFVQFGEKDDVSFVGITYQKNQPYAIIVGHKERIENLSLESGQKYQFVGIEDEPESGIFLICRRATDADVCFV